MIPVTDYRIYQRDLEGYAEVLVAGVLPDEYSTNWLVATRVCREEDNLTIIPWTLCECDDRKWQITLRVPAGGLYTIETSAHPNNTITDWGHRLQYISHVGVGELFMVTGQSNMAGYGRDAAYDPPQLGVHCYGNNGKWAIAVHPLNNSVDTIYPENRELTSGVSPLLAFARQVKQQLNAPVGLVQASLGGSPLKAWNPDEDGTLYRAMLRRLESTGPVGGVVWYQGCSDANAECADTYLARFTRMVELWRERLGNIPFITVQLNRWTNLTGGTPVDRFWGIVREAQRQAARIIPNLCVVPATDLSTTDGIHNSSGGNVILGERMARVYLKSHWGLAGQLPADVEHVIRVDDTHLLAVMTPNSHVYAMDNISDGIDAEDCNGLISCVEAVAHEKGLMLTLSRPCDTEVRLHMLWRATPPVFAPRSRNGMPILSCYGVKAE